MDGAVGTTREGEAAAETSWCPPYQKKSAREAVSAWGMKTVRLRFPHRIRYSQRCHEDTLLGLLEVMIAALGSSIITSTDFVLPH